MTDPVEQARTRTLTFFRFASDNRELFRIVFGHGASFHDVVRRCQDSFINDMRESLEVGMASGAFRSADAAVWAQALIGMSLQVVSWWIEQEGVPIEEVARSLSDLALHGIAAIAPSSRMAYRLIVPAQRRCAARVGVDDTRCAIGDRRE